MSLEWSLLGKAWVVGILIVASSTGWALAHAPADAAETPGADANQAAADLSKLALIGVDDALDSLRPGGETDGILHAARTLADARDGTRGHDTRPLARAAAAGMTLHGHERMTSGTDATGTQLIVQATDAQLARVGADAEADPARPQVQDPVTAVLMVADAYGIHPSDIDAAALTALHGLDPELQSALAALITAFLAYDQANQQVETQADLATVVRARTEMLLAADQMRTLFDTMGTQSSNGPLQVGNVLSIDVGPGDNLYTDNFVLLIDAGGNDEYQNNAGGSGVLAGRCNILTTRTSAALFDLRGDDRYVGALDCGGNGGGFGGAGVLVDYIGQDVYMGGSHGTNGGAHQLGLGLLADLNGDDLYMAGDTGTNGGAHAESLGLLIDATGDDDYSAGAQATNGGGGLFGFGALVDATGDDSYLALGRGTNGGGHEKGFGFLFDGDGSDDYVSAGEGANGGASQLGVGTLIDLGGNDEYIGNGHGSNGGGATGGLGMLLDRAGHDRYQSSHEGVNGGAYAGGFGVLLEGGGNDVYAAEAVAVNGGASDGDARTCLIVTFCTAGPLAWGLLLDSAGVDRFEELDGDSSGTDRSVYPKGNVGAQLDFVPEIEEP